MRSLTIVLAGWLVATTLTGSAAFADATDETETQRLARRLAALEAANADLERRMALYRSGLEQAVAELNRLREGEGNPLRMAMNRPRPRPTRHDPARRSLTRRSALELGDRLLSSPRTTVRGRRAEVSGMISNPNREHVYGTLVIELLCDGMPIGEARLPFDVPSHERVAYSQAFELTGYAAGSYSARVGLAY